ncbi:HAL/PAL/TAL family ammonia-lyase [Acidaminobacter hydrogenoformans]|uniref:Histidine ammonia-lyase n=1 Tax=Acidaminobacter hydrogenoformans DSM 2784 TaxID=1120920 RepID=A0A1G5S243_9FIRM|nr:aromatic amino acid ammonia-lyase [Acidaminobacter hydrogenoformans]SCZ80207.1 histidine ammonia-lyase [Acidaminobacter hydrogenoformans DSM 2784]
MKSLKTNLKLEEDRFEDTAMVEGESRRIVELGGTATLEALVAVARHKTEVAFSDAYCERVSRSRALVEKWIREGRVMYGITTGFGALCDRVISEEETAQLQKNIILSHSTSVGEPLSIEQTRAVMFMMLQNMGQGYSGVSLALLERIRLMLNLDLIPFAPREGSVGYLSVEAHIGMAIIGLGKIFENGVAVESRLVLRKHGLEPFVLGAKEGLALISGTTSPTALAALAIFDMKVSTLSADIIGALSLEVNQGNIKAFDERLMRARPYAEQGNTAANVRTLLQDSEIIKDSEGRRLQDALSLRAMPQLHGAVKRTINDAVRTVEEEMNTCSDNPIIWPEGADGHAMSGCHCDSSYVGLAMDSAAIAATMLAKMSERRNYRLITEHLSGMPWFLIQNPGLNSGLMIPQYTQAGLLNDMKTLSHPSSVDSIPTCGGQEDYVAMGYNAAKKALSLAEKLEYILAIELLSIYQAHQFLDPGIKPASVSAALFNELKKHIPTMTQDQFLHPHIEYLKGLVHSGRLVELAEEVAGPLA